MKECPDCGQKMREPEETEEGDYWCPECGYLFEDDEDC